MSKHPRIFLALPFLLILLAAACSGSASSSDSTVNNTATTTTASTERATLVPGSSTQAPAPTATSSLVETQVTPAASPSAFELDPPGPSGQRIYDLVKALSVDIGPRPAGSSQEEEAANYAAGLLHSFGYDVELQKFNIGTETSRNSTLSLVTPESRTLISVPFAYSAAASVQGRLLDGGRGEPQDLPADAAGAILLIERGGTTFREKVDAAADAGAAGVIIYNNEPELFYGTLGSIASLPAVSISQSAGQDLLDQIAAGGVEVELEVDSLSDATSYNVIATPPGEECATITGGHYDSVQIAPGASDNASGSATVIEMAAVMADRGEMNNNCFALWGAEEIGLLGSNAYVASLTPEERGNLRAVLNLDMVGVGDQTWLLIGDSNLQQMAQAEATALGIDTTIGSLPSNASSDHASFLNAGIPAVIFHRTSDPLLHTPQDVIDRVHPELLEEAARMGIALLEALNGKA